MANAANSFIGGFTGGMGAMTNMINSRDQRAYNAKRMEYMEQDRGFQQQQQDWKVQDRAQQQKEIKRKESLRSFSQINHIRQNLDDDKKKGLYNKSMFEYVNQKFKPFMDAQFGKDTKTQFNAFKPIEGGLFVPGLKYTNPEGKEVTDYLRDENGKALAISSDDLMGVMGSVPGILDHATQLEAQILGKGGQLPKRPTKFGELVNEDGLMGQYNQNTNEFVTKGGGRSKGSSKWKRIEQVEVPHPTIKGQIITRTKERLEGTDQYRYIDDDNAGNIQTNYMKSNTPDSLAKYFGTGETTPDPDATDEEKAKNKAAKKLGMEMPDFEKYRQQKQAGNNASAMDKFLRDAEITPEQRREAQTLKELRRREFEEQRREERRKQLAAFSSH